MKRYLLFYGSDYYPSGGWKDFCGSFDSTEEAKTHLLAKQYSRDWWHIVDTVTGDVEWSR